jgi:hypothetical protein
MAQYGPARLRTDCGASADKGQLPEPIGATWTAEHHARAAARSYLSIHCCSWTTIAVMLRSIMIRNMG